MFWTGFSKALSQSFLKIHSQFYTKAKLNCPHKSNPFFFKVQSKLFFTIFRKLSENSVFHSDLDFPKSQLWLKLEASFPKGLNLPSRFSFFQVSKQFFRFSLLDFLEPVSYLLSIKFPSIFRRLLLVSYSSNFCKIST